jgi:hypothetical protein
MTGLQLGHGGGGRQLCVGGGKAFCCGFEINSWGKKYSLKSQSGGNNGTVSKLRVKLDRVRHTKWKDWQEEQGPNRNIMHCPVRQAEYPYDIGRPPVGNIVYLNLSPKLGQGCWGSSFRGRVSRR